MYPVRTSEAAIVPIARHEMVRTGIADDGVDHVHGVGPVHERDHDHGVAHEHGAAHATEMT
jgi:hypothetical protein